MAETDLIELKNSNALYKYPVDADQLMHNFKVLAAQTGGESIKNVVESSGQTYSTLIENQLAMAIAQYVMSGTIFNEVGDSDAYVLYGRDGMEIPYRYTEGMVVTFKTNHTNMGAATIQLGSLAPHYIHVGGNDIAAGYMPTDKFVSFVYTKEQSAEGDITYAWYPVESQSSGGSGSESDTPSPDSGSSSNYPLVAIRKLLTSAGLAYSQSDDTLLSQAISHYAHGIHYTSTYANGIYVLTTPESHLGPRHYFPGLVVMFTIPTTNDTDYTLLKLGTLQSVPFLDENGFELVNSSLYAGQLVVAVYQSGAFRLMSSYMPSIKLGNGNIITGISDDQTLDGDSSTVAASEHAVRGYVESKLKGSLANTIVSGYTDESNNPIAVRLVGSHHLEVVAGDAAFISETPNDPSQIITSSSDEEYVLKNTCLVDLNDYSYWETEKTGFAIDDLSRTVAGDYGGKYIVNKYDSDGVEVYRNNPPKPEWFGLTSFTKRPTAVKIKFTDDDHTPNSVYVQVNFGNTVSGTWYDVVNAVYNEHPEEGDAAYETDMEYGKLYALEKDEDGYYRLELPSYYDVGDLSGASASMNDPLPFPDQPTNPFAMRVVIRDSSNLQQVPTDVLNQDGYDPDTDTTSPQTSVQVIDVQFGRIENAPLFSFTYPNTNVGELKGPKYFTQYVYEQGDLTEDPPVYPTSELDTLDEGENTLYIQQGEQYLKLTHSSNIFKQSETPAATAAREGGVWFETTSNYPNTYVCQSVGDHEEPDPEDPSQTIIVKDYGWIKADVMLIAKVTVYKSSLTDTGSFTSVTPMAYGTSITKTYSATKNMDETIVHNFGQAVAVSFTLECVDDDLGYVAGERVEVLPFYYHRYYVTPVDVEKTVYGPAPTPTDPDEEPVAPAIGTVTVKEYTPTDRVVAMFASSTEQETRIKLVNFELLQKGTNDTAQITDNKWKLTVLIKKG